jgi:hypothetical protein
VEYRIHVLVVSFYKFVFVLSHGRESIDWLERERRRTGWKKRREEEEEEK